MSVQEFLNSISNTRTREKIKIICDKIVVFAVFVWQIASLRMGKYLPKTPFFSFSLEMHLALAKKPGLIHFSK